MPRSGAERKRAERARKRGAGTPLAEPAHQSGAERQAWTRARKKARKDKQAVAVPEVSCEGAMCRAVCSWLAAARLRVCKLCLWNPTVVQVMAPAMTSMLRQR